VTVRAQSSQYASSTVLPAQREQSHRFRMSAVLIAGLKLRASEA